MENTSFANRRSPSIIPITFLHARIDLQSAGKDPPGHVVRSCFLDGAFRWFAPNAVIGSINGTVVNGNARCRRTISPADCPGA